MEHITEKELELLTELDKEKVRKHRFHMFAERFKVGDYALALGHDWGEEGLYLIQITEFNFPKLRITGHESWTFKEPIVHKDIDSFWCYKTGELYNDKRPELVDRSLHNV